MRKVIPTFLLAAGVLAAGCSDGTGPSLFDDRVGSRHGGSGGHHELPGVGFEVAGPVRAVDVGARAVTLANGFLIQFLDNTVISPPGVLHSLQAAAQDVAAAPRP